MVRVRGFRHIIVTIGWILAATGAFAAEPEAIRIFSPKPGSELAAVAESGEPRLRARVADFDLTALESIAAGFTRADATPSLQLDLFDDVLMNVVVQRVASFRPGRFVIRGVVAQLGRPNEGIALFSVVDGALQAEVTTSEGRKFAIDDLGRGACRISEIDPAATHFRCLTEQEDPSADSLQAETNQPDAGFPAAGPPHFATAADEIPVVDIMILYTTKMANSFSSVSAMEAHSQLAVELANSIFEQSLARVRMRLVHTTRVNYTESGSVGTDITRLVNLTDGHLDEVASLREQHQADVVHLFGDDGSGLGVANFYPSDYFGILMGRRLQIFVHELGHNFGCQHDRNSAGVGMSYAYGYIFPAGGELWGCIMSYVGFENAHRLNYFSNPDKTYKGAPMGIPKGRPNAADNVRRINVTAPVVAAYRSGIGSTSRVPVLASPPRLDFPATPVGSISPQRSLRLAYSSASIQRPIRITDFQVTGDASAFQVQIFDNNTKQFISGNSFTIAPPDSIQLVVRFQPSSSQAAEANIIFKADDPSFRYDLPPIRLTGNVAAPLLKNISTRGYVGTGDNVLIGGLIIGGTSSREVLIRAVGGSLAGLGVAQALRDPVIELYHGSTLIARNDDWGDGFGYEPIRWSGFAPADDLESAVLTRLEPGNYTAIVHGFGDATGVALIEAYDLEVNPGTELLNISTRGQVQTGDNVMIGGFILGGTSPTRVVVRAIGPSLTERGVSSPLQDPTLDLHNSEGTRIASNDNWRSDDESGIVGTGIAPHDDREAALVATLPPSGYTAIVRGANQTRGVALVEVYKTAAE